MDEKDVKALIEKALAEKAAEVERLKSQVALLNAQGGNRGKTVEPIEREVKVSDNTKLTVRVGNVRSGDDFGEEVGLFIGKAVFGKKRISGKGKNAKYSEPEWFGKNGTFITGKSLAETLSAINELVAEATKRGYFQPKA